MSIEVLQNQVHKLAGDVGALTNAVQMMTSMWRSQEESATTGRRIMHEKMDGVSNRLTTLTGRVDQMGEKIEIIEPSVAAFKATRHRAEGAMSLGKYLWGALLIIAGLTGYGFSEWFKWFLHQPPIPPHP